MTRFSERHGYRQAPGPLDERQITPSLRAGLWDCISLHFFKDFQTDFGARAASFDQISGWIWFRFFREATDERPYSGEKTLKTLRDRFYDYRFPEIYDFVEFMASLPGDNKEYRDLCNIILERERAAFRFVGEIIDEVEVGAINFALKRDESQAVRQHIAQALALYGDRSNPDYRNSVKESISAVEAAARFITGDTAATLGKALGAIERSHPLHPALREGFNKIYGYTSDAKGIRHAMSDQSTKVTEADARFMLVSCSAFANYLISLKAN